jgi:transposase InsO family protein
LALHSNNTRPTQSAANSFLFLERAIEEFPFPIQRIQTDRGREFFAYSFQEKLMEYAIKFRPVKPALPHLNGKVERSQRTDLDEFCRTADLKSHDLSQRLEEWQDHYNQYRVHGIVEWPHTLGYLVGATLGHAFQR